MSRLFPAFLLAAIVLPALAGQAQEVEGAEEYLAECARCHGPEGSGTEWGPPIIDDGIAGSHFWMATGRMPIRRPDDPIRPREPLLSEEQIASILEYVETISDGPDIPELDLEAGELNAGSIIYITNCAACHGTTGVGGAIVRARNATDVFGIDPILIAEAIRSGPGAMPVFGEETISDEELNSVVRYVTFLQEKDSPGGWSLGRWGPVAEGAAAWVIGIGVAAAAAYWTERTGHHDDQVGTHGHREE